MASNNRIGALLIIIAGFASTLGCQKSSPQPSASITPAVTPAQEASEHTAQRPFFVDYFLPTPRESTANAALVRAIALIGARDYDEALEELQQANALDPNPLLNQEIDRVRNLQAQQLAANLMLSDLRSLLRQGRATETSELATAALRQFGDGPAAEEIMVLKRQADALIADVPPASRPEQAQLVRDAKDARANQQLRAALASYELALQFGENRELSEEVEKLRITIHRYDLGLENARLFRQDPWQLEAALAALEDAAAAWNTPQVRQEIAEIEFALSRRRQRLAIVDFEVRGDVGVPFAGRMVADELVPTFRTRFDLFERGQIAPLLGELKIAANGLAVNDANRLAFGRAARVRYLVVGSLTPIHGILVHARMIDTESGLIVQTARLHAASPQELMRRLPELTQQLLMSDQERLEFERQHRAAARQPPPLPALVPLFDPWQPTKPTAQSMATAFAPVVVGDLVLADFVRLPAAPSSAGHVPPTLTVAERPRFQRQLLVLQVQRGDDLFRNGRFVDAFRHYQFCLLLSPESREVLPRLDACRPHLPREVLAAPPGEFFGWRPARPTERVAVLNFAVFAPTGDLPQELSSWLPERLAPWLSPPFEVVDDWEIGWYMNQLGITVQEVVQDPIARRWLGRALGVRYFVFGHVRRQGGIAVDAYLVDAEQGFRMGEGSLRIRQPVELSLRMRELAQALLFTPDERLRLRQQAAVWEAELLDAQTAMEAGQFVVALDLFATLRKRYPLNVQIGFYAGESERLALRAQVDARTRRTVSTDADLARRQTEAILAMQAAVRSQPGDVSTLTEAQRKAASQRLLMKGRTAKATGDLPAAVQFLEGAAALEPSAGVLQELANAKAALTLERTTAPPPVSVGPQRLREQGQAAMEELKFRINEVFGEQRQVQAARLAELRRRDDRTWSQLLEQARQATHGEDYSTAIAALTAARQLRPSSEGDQLLAEALAGQARQRLDSSSVERDADTADETRRHALATEAARRNQVRHAEAVRNAAAAFQRGDLVTALTEYRRAAQVIPSAEAHNGIRTVEEALAKQQQEAATRKQQLEAESNRRTQLAKYRQAASVAEQKKEFRRAIEHLRAAWELAPEDATILAEITRIESAVEKASAEDRKEQNEHKNPALQRHVNLARAQMQAGQFSAAEVLLARLQKEAADDSNVQALARDVASAKVQASKVAIEQAAIAQSQASEQASEKAVRLEQLRQEQADLRDRQLSQLLETVESAIGSQQFDVAHDGLREAAKLAPTDPNVGRMQRKLADARTTAQAVRIKREAEEKARATADEKVKTDKFRDHLRRGREAMTREEFKEAVAQLQAAVDLYPNDSDALLLLGLAETKLKQVRTENAAVAAERKAADDAKAKADEAVRVQEEQRARKIEAIKLVQRGKELIEQRRWADAVAAFAAAADKDPANQEAARLLITTQQRLDEALAAARRQSSTSAANRAASDGNGLVERARKLEESGRVSEAITLYRQAVDHQPTDERIRKLLRQAETRFHLAQGQRDLRAGRYSDAIKNFEIVLERAPDHSEAKRLLKQARERN